MSEPNGNAGEANTGTGTNQVNNNSGNTGTQNTGNITQTGQYDYTKVITPDGKFAENWKEGLPEEIRHEICLDTCTSFSELAKQYVNAQKLIGRNKVVIPGEKATQSEIDQFQMALGRPKTKNDYKIDIPNELKDYYDPSLIEEAKNLAFSQGFNQKQLNALLEFRKKEIELGLKQITEEEKAAFEEAERIIVEEAGEALDEQRHYADLFIADNCPNEKHKEKLLTALNSSALRPYVFNMLANAYRKYCGEAPGIPAGQAAPAMTPAMLESKAQELMATPGYLSGELKNSNPAMYNRLTREISELYNRANKA